MTRQRADNERAPAAGHTITRPTSRSCLTGHSTASVFCGLRGCCRNPSPLARLSTRPRSRPRRAGGSGSAPRARGLRAARCWRVAVVRRPGSRLRRAGGSGSAPRARGLRAARVPVCRPRPPRAPPRFFSCRAAPAPTRAPRRGRAERRTAAGLNACASDGPAARRERAAKRPLFFAPLLSFIACDIVSRSLYFGEPPEQQEV
jgi:hypothetical protein